jgi:hypothetical protein
VCALSLPTFELYDQLHLESTTLPTLGHKREQIAMGTAGPNWMIVDDIVLYKGCNFLLDTSASWAPILLQAHGMGHEGVQKTLHRLRAMFFTPHDGRLGRDFIHGCSVCQRHETKHPRPVGLLQPLDTPTMVWQDIAMDFIEGFLETSRKSVILTVVDRLSKYTHFIMFGHPYTATSVVVAFFEQIVRLHGVPASIVSDHNPVFTSTMWKELFRLYGTSLRTSSVFRPQTDGQSKVTNRIIAVYLCCLDGDPPKSWLCWLPWVEFCYNTSYQTALKETPFEVVYGRAPPQLAPFQLGTAHVAAVDRQLQDRDIFLAKVRGWLLQAQNFMKTAHDKSYRPLEFNPDGLIWLCLNQRAIVFVHDRSLSKLVPKYYWLYRVLERIGGLAYRLQLPARVRIHDVFHVTFLKKYTSAELAAIPPLPPIVRSRAVPQPQQVVHARPTVHSWDLLVTWQNSLPVDASWEQLEAFKDAYPDFQLED